MKRKAFKLCAAGGFLAAALAAIPAAAQQAARSVDPHATETKAQHDARMHWWRQARFGMFIHWGLYAVPAGIWKGRPIGGLGEWIMNDGKIPVADYAALAPEFDPTQFNADVWARTAKDTGMKYMVITAKHHDGFAMFHSEADPFNITDATPFKRDPIAELRAACRKHGIKFGVYYSQAQDWHHPGGAAYGGHWDPAQAGDLDAYVRTVAAPQVRELLTRYRPAVLWWDTPVDMSKADVAALTSAFAQDPRLIANNRLGNGVPGDTETPEQFIPATGYPGRDWETCMTINNTWGYKSDDTNFKSSEDLLRNLIDIASKGGNYLLNVGPDATGVIPAPEVQRLHDIGVWLHKNGRAIYGTTASPYKRLPFDGRATVKGRTLYLHVFRWPEGGLTLSGLQTPVTGAKALATGQTLTVRKSAEGVLTIGKPDQLDPVATVIALSLSGPPVVHEVEPMIAPLPDRTYLLSATDAVLEGSTIQVEHGPENPNIGFWTNPQDAAHWTISVPAERTGTYVVTLLYACAPGSEGSALTLQMDGQATGVAGTVAQTASWTDYQLMVMKGTLRLTPGTHVLRLTAQSKPGLAVINVRRIRLVLDIRR